MTVAAVGARNKIVGAERFADPDCHGFLAHVQVGQAGHQRAGIELVDLFLEQANHLHAPEHPQPFLDRDSGTRFRPVRGYRHLWTPDICAKTSNTTAKSFSTQPMPRAAVRNSLLTAVVGMGTSSWRPSSNASSMSFCIMLTLNHASFGICRTKGPRYWIMGEATALCVSTSTATSRGMPLFSASSIPSEKASIWT